MPINSAPSGALDRAIAFLSTSQEEDGSWPDFIVPPAHEGSEWTTAYVGWCLDHLPADRRHRVALALEKAKFFLQQSRRPCGGWGFCSRSPVDADSAAYAILFLLPFADGQGDGFKEERELLLGHYRGEDGGFGTYQRRNLSRYPPTSGYYTSTPCVTASTALALLHLSNEQDLPFLQRAADYLLGQQHPRGYWDSFWWEKGVYSTFIATHFLQQFGQGEDQLRRAIRWLTGIQDVSGCWKGDRVEKGIPFLTAVALETLLVLCESPSSSSIQLGLRWLLEHQKVDGSWDSFPIMKVPDPNEPWSPAKPYAGRVVPGRRRNFVTATVVSFLSRLLVLDRDLPGVNRQNHQLPLASVHHHRGESLDIVTKRESQSIEEQFSRHVDGLPAELRALAASTPLWKERGAGLGHFLPFWLNEEFAKGMLLSQARQMALANRFGQTFCLLQDAVIDRHAGTKPEILILLDIFFFQFLRGYQKLFPASHPFWSYFEAYWQEYLQALAWEKARHQGRITPYTREDFLWIGRKLSPIKICCAGMALLAGREEEIPSLARMVEHLHMGYQLLDDLEDWPEDIKNSEYTYPLTLVHLQSPDQKRDISLPVEEIERLLWTDGLAAEVFQEAVEFLSQSLGDIVHLSLPGLKAWIQKIRKGAQQKMKTARHQVTRGRLPQVQIFSQNGCHLVYNVSTSGLYEIGEEAASLLRRLAQGAWPEDCAEDNELLRELQTAGVLSSLPQPRDEVEQPPLTSLYLIVSPRCNLACSYCYVHEEEYGGASESMSLEVGEGAVDLLLRESKDQSAVRIVFFGGEPLLNPRLITHVIDYSRRRSATYGKEMQFRVITNGTLLSPQMVDLFDREKVSVQVSLDGPPEVQNRQRPTIRGEETYQWVVQNIRELQEGGVESVSISATLASLTPSPVEILQHLLSLEPRSVSMQYAHPTRANRHVWQESDLPVMMKHQEELVAYFFGNLHEGRVIPYTNLLKSLARVYHRHRVVYPCSAGTRMGAVTTDGDVFPCFRFTEEPALAVGNVSAGLDREKLRPYIQNRVDQFQPCQSCWARYLCAGDCTYDNLLVSGDMTRRNPYQCTLMRHHFRVVMQLLARIKRELPELVEGFEKGDVFSFLPQVVECDR